MKRIFIWIVIIGVAAVAGACASRNLGCGREGFMTFNCPVPNDNQIRENVKIRLTSLLISGCDSVDIEVTDGIVSLSGVIYDEGMAAMISSAVMALGGVRGVVNNIKIYSKTDSDIQIAAQVRQAFLSQPFILNPQSININVFDGVVVLSGGVQSEYDMETAVMIAHGISGVSAVYNNMTIIGN